MDANPDKISQECQKEGGREERKMWLLFKKKKKTYFCNDVKKQQPFFFSATFINSLCLFWFIMVSTTFLSRLLCLSCMAIYFIYFQSNWFARTLFIGNTWFLDTFKITIDVWKHQNIDKYNILALHLIHSWYSDGYAPPKWHPSISVWSG